MPPGHHIVTYPFDSRNPLKKTICSQDQLMKKNLIEKNTKTRKKAIVLYSEESPLLDQALQVARLQGCQIFLGPNIPKRHKYTKGPQTTPNGHTLFQVAINYTKWPKIYQHFPFQGPPKYTQI
jgi:hypothetical protein